MFEHLLSTNLNESQRVGAMQTKIESRKTESRMITRFSIAMLGCTAMGISIGRSMPDDIGKLGIIAGVIALFFYLYEARRDFKLRQEQNEIARKLVEIRLLEQTLPAKQIQPTKSSLYKV